MSDNHSPGRLVINAPKSAPDWETWGPEVVKIVIGPSPGSDGEPLELAALPGDLAQRFPKLTHLHLWRLAGLTSLPALPPGLECLDVRGCADLTVLPSLPGTLTTLDLGGCEKLGRLPAAAPVALERFFFNGCAAIKPHTLAAFLEGLQASRVVEIDGSGSPAVTSLDEFPRASLRKLVLRGCEKLSDAGPLAEFAVLEHLNLGGCTSLEVLPDLPPCLRYLVLYGAERLRSFRGQDIGPYDRGAEGQDVARAFLTRKKFGRHLAVMPHAKVLLMGDGRVGKTTLAKRLLWEELDAVARKRGANLELQPDPAQEFTHKVSFWRWETGLSLPDGETAALAERAQAAGAELPRRRDGLLDGAVRLWDFGGQEIYHHTHRIFASEGSLFVLVWREESPPVEEAPADVTAEEWQEWNRSRPLDYWLDYVYSMRPDAQVALVCTHCARPDERESKPDWKARAPKHAHRDLPGFFVDSLDAECGQHQEFQRLVRWLREASGREARRIGILQPRFYREVSDLLDRWLTENAEARRAGRPPQHLLCAWDQWEASVRAAHRDGAGAGGVALESADIQAITDYLHEAGHLFQLRAASQRAIVVDQEWASELIYRLLLPGGQLRQTVKRNGGWFVRSELEADPHWVALADATQRERLLAYMEECRVVTRIGAARNQRIGEDVYLASDKWLLPEFKHVRGEVDAAMGRAREQAGAGEHRAFEFGTTLLNEFDFRRLQAHLARSFGTRAIYFRNGFQARTDAERGWCLRMRWSPRRDDPFQGTIDAVLVAQEEDLARAGRRLEELVFAEGSPLADRGRDLKHRATGESDWQPDYFRAKQGEGMTGRTGAGGLGVLEPGTGIGRLAEYDIGISSSGADKVEAEAVVKALQDAGFRVTWYRLPECRLEDCRGVMQYQMSLGKPPCILLLLSDGYLRDSPFDNWYCAWELADAIRRLGQGERTEVQTLAMYKLKPGGVLDSRRLDQLVVELMNHMAEYFAKAYRDVPTRDLRNFEHYNRLSLDFLAALEGGQCGKFSSTCGTLGYYLEVPKDLSLPGAFDPLIDAVRRALKASAGRGR